MVKRIAVFSVASLLLLLMAGCSLFHVPKPMNSVQVGVLKGSLGHIGVVAATYVPEEKIQVPAKGPAQGAKEGALVGAFVPLRFSLEAMSSCNDDLCLFIPAIGVALMPVGAIVGSVGGALTADSPEVVSGREASVNSALLGLNMQKLMQADFAEKLQELNLYPVKVMVEEGPAMPGQKVDYRYLKLAGIDTVSEICVKELALAGDGTVRNDLGLFISVQIRLVSTQDNYEVCSKSYRCSSTAQKFEEWAADDAEQLRHQIAKCCNKIAADAVNDLFVNDSLLYILSKEPIDPRGQGRH
jgi:hypothetical protein